MCIADILNGQAKFVNGSICVEDDLHMARCRNIDEYKIYPIMSITKLMTCLLVSNILGPRDLIMVLPVDIQRGSGVALKPFDVLTVSDAYKAALVSSSNTICYTLARVAGGRLLKENV